ncbi:MAG: signal peptidase I [Rhodothermales bacterium]
MVDATPPPLAAEPTPATPPERPSRLRPWVIVVAAALVAALGIRLFAAEAFRIPTASMERNLLVGDFLLVSKLHYGPRTPVTVGLPFTDRYVRGLTLPSVRLPGFAEVERGDVVVFNHPTEHGPVDRRTHFIKRVVGLPGDTVAVVEKDVRVNGEPLPLGPEMQFDWLVALDRSVPFSLGAFRELGVRSPAAREGDGMWRVRMTLPEAETVATWPAVVDVRPAVATRTEMLFPFGTRQTLDDYGPVVVPKRGQTVRLDAATWPAVRDVVERYEGHAARRFADGRYEIDGAITDTYTFEQDYYFVLGDNRDDSSDSRRWGFVPHSHLVGKAVLVYFSWDAAEGRPRFGRLFRPIR